MKLYGVALVPERQTREKIVAWQMEHLGVVGGPKLSVDGEDDGCLPHTTVIQCPFHEESLTDGLLDVPHTFWKHGGGNQSSFEKVYTKPVGWVFLGVERTRWMEKLHMLTLAETTRFIDRDQLENESEPSDFKGLELEYWRTYGYPYVGDKYRPHVTLGRNPSLDRLGGTTDGLRGLTIGFLEGETCVYDEMVLYEAGKDGSLDRVIASKRW